MMMVMPGVVTEQLLLELYQYFKQNSHNNLNYEQLLMFRSPVR